MKLRPILMLRILFVSLLAFCSLVAILSPEVPDIDPDPVWIEVRKTGKIRLQGIGDENRRLIIRIDRENVAANNIHGISCCDFLAVGGGLTRVFAINDGFSAYLPPTNR